MNPRTSLANRVGRSPLNTDEIEALARRAWHDSGMALINPDSLSDPWEAQIVRNIAARLYGQRRYNRPDGKR